MTGYERIAGSLFFFIILACILGMAYYAGKINTLNDEWKETNEELRKRFEDWAR